MVTELAREIDANLTGISVIKEKIKASRYNSGFEFSKDSLEKARMILNNPESREEDVVFERRRLSLAVHLPDVLKTGIVEGKIMVIFDSAGNDVVTCRHYNGKLI